MFVHPIYQWIIKFLSSLGGCIDKNKVLYPGGSINLVRSGMKLKYQRLLLAIVVLIGLVFQVHSQEDSMDPVARQIMMSMDAPAEPEATGSARATQNMSLPAASTSARSITGSWHMELENGANINLTLSQSGNMVFGKGDVISDTATEWATASGSISGNILRLYVVPEDGAELYSLSLDLSGQTPAKIYSIFRASAATSSGTVRKVSYNTRE